MLPLKRERGVAHSFNCLPRLPDMRLAQWRRHHRARGGTCPHFYEWLGTGEGTVEGRLITTMQWYAYNSTADCRTELKFYLEIQTSVQAKAIARYSQWNCATHERIATIYEVLRRLWRIIFGSAAHNTPRCRQQPCSEATFWSIMATHEITTGGAGDLSYSWEKLLRVASRKDLLESHYQPDTVKQCTDPSLPPGQSRQFEYRKHRARFCMRVWQSIKHFLSRVSILSRDMDIANLSVFLSVCPSVRNVPVSDENGLTHRHSFVTIR